MKTLKLFASLLSLFTLNSVGCASKLTPTAEKKPAIDKIRSMIPSAVIDGWNAEGEVCRISSLGKGEVDVRNKSDRGPDGTIKGNIQLQLVFAGVKIEEFVSEENSLYLAFDRLPGSQIEAKRHFTLSVKKNGEELDIAISQSDYRFFNTVRGPTKSRNCSVTIPRGEASE